MKFKEKEYQNIFFRIGRMATGMGFVVKGRVAKAVYGQYVSREAEHCKFLSQEGCCQQDPIGIGCHPGTTVCEAHPLDKCITKS